MSINSKIAKIAGAAIGFTLIGSSVACSSDADVASQNLSKAAEQFEVNRRIVAINNITDQYLFVVEGRCSIEFPDGRYEVICKLSNGTFAKHFVSRADQTTMIAEQINGTEVDTDQYRVIFKPEVIVPNVDRP
jgi:hypothetical protein